MQFITSLFGGSGNSILTSVFALGIVLVLIVLALWLFKLVFKASSNVGRGRNRRLTVVDTLMVDPKRQLLIIRRDNVEHLIMTGGPQDLVVETGIAVEEAPAATARRPVPSVPIAAKPVPRPAARPAPAAPVIKAPPPVVNPPAPTIPASASANSATALARLRDLGKSAPDSKPTSLRHTGLMRPVSLTEPAILPNENTNGRRPDSAKEIVNDSSDHSGQTQLGETDDDDGYIADRH